MDSAVIRTTSFKIFQDVGIKSSTLVASGDFTFAAMGKSTPMNEAGKILISNYFGDSLFISLSSQNDQIHNILWGSSIVRCSHDGPSISLLMMMLYQETISDFEAMLGCAVLSKQPFSGKSPVKTNFEWLSKNWLTRKNLDPKLIMVFFCGFYLFTYFHLFSPYHSWFGAVYGMETSTHWSKEFMSMRTHEMNGYVSRCVGLMMGFHVKMFWYNTKAWRCHDVLLKHQKAKRKGTHFTSPSALKKTGLPDPNKS